MIGGEGAMCPSLDFFLDIQDSSDLYLHRGYNWVDLCLYNNLFI